MPTSMLHPTAELPRSTRDDFPVTETPFGRAAVVSSVEHIDPFLRQRAFEQHCKDFRYYEIAERTLSAQFDHRYFVLENPTTGEVAIQPFFFVDQDLTTGLPAGVRAGLAAVRSRWPRFLKMRMLMVGCSAGEGQLHTLERWAVECLHAALDLYMPGSGAAVVVLKDFPSEYRQSLRPFSQNGYRRVPSMPAATLRLEFKSFEEYMQTRLSKVFRKNLRRKFKALEGVAPLKLELVSDATPFLEEVYALYLQTFRRSKFQFEKLTRGYFQMIGEQMPERARFFLWRQQGRLVAFSLCMLHEGTLYDFAVGLDYTVALDLHLYFVTWRDIIEWSLANGVHSYHTGPLNYDPKLHLRLSLAPQDLYARHSSPLLNPLFKIALKYLEPTRHDRVLAQFHNAHELA